MDKNNPKPNRSYGLIIFILLAGVGAFFINNIQNENSEATSNLDAAETADKLTAVEEEISINEKTDKASTQNSNQNTGGLVDGLITDNKKASNEEKTDTSSDLKSEIFNLKIENNTEIVYPDGDLVVVVLAGQTRANQVLEVLVNDEIVEKINSDSQGEFSVIIDLPHSDKIRTLNIRTLINGDVIYAERDIIVTPSISSSEKEKVEASVDDDSDNGEGLGLETTKDTTDQDVQITAELNDSRNVDNDSRNVDEVKTRQDVTSAENSQKPNEKEKNKATTTGIGSEIIASGTQTANGGQISNSTAENTVPEEGEKLLNELNTKQTLKINKELKEAHKKEQTATLESTEHLDTEKKLPEKKSPTVLVADDKGVRLVTSEDNEIEPESPLDTISYAESGEVSLTGRGNPKNGVLVYLDNKPISSARMDSLGTWNTSLKNVEPGIYTLRIDQVDFKGKVISRLETPFKRESKAVLQDQMLALEDPARINIVTVQPGYTLWAIARKRYGKGILYVRVFEANRNKIKNPDLIYPGQIFKLPD